MTKKAFIKTTNHGRIPIRKVYTGGEHIECVEVNDGEYAEIRIDKNKKLFAVLIEWNNEKERWEDEYDHCICYTLKGVTREGIREA